jgi:hypothetical protein
MDRLTGRQTAIIWAGIGVIVGLGLYVPWTEGVHSYARGYSFIFSPPNGISHLDTTRVLIPMGIVAGLTTALAFVGPSAVTTGTILKKASGVAKDALKTFAIVGVVIGGLVLLAFFAAAASTAKPEPEKEYLTPTGRVAPLSKWTDEELDQRIREAKEEERAGNRK